MKDFILTLSNGFSSLWKQRMEEELTSPHIQIGFAVWHRCTESHNIKQNLQVVAKILISSH